MGSHYLFSGILTDYDNKYSLGSLLRRRRSKHIAQVIDAIYEEHGQVDILDIGGRANYWEVLPASTYEQKNVRITLLNEPSELAVNASEPVQPYISSTYGDARNLTEIKDNSFHLAHSNSVIEHVGSWADMQAMAAESRRVAPYHYTQTPNFWFPVEPHFVCPAYHWFPEPIRVALLQRLHLGHMDRQESVGDAVEVVKSVHLITRSMLQSLYPSSQIKTERFLGLAKSLIAVNLRLDAKSKSI